MEVLVIGAGLAGVTSAWYLAQAGCKVTVVERQPGPGSETSFANGGQVSISHPEPWANPSAPATILRWLGRKDAPLLFRLRADTRNNGAGPPASCANACPDEPCSQHLAAIANLATYSRRELQALKTATGIRISHPAKRASSICSRAEQDFKQLSLHVRKELEAMGIRTRTLTPDEATALEPALAALRPRLAGVLHGMDDESGDAHLFCTANLPHGLRRQASASSTMPVSTISTWCGGGSAESACLTRTSGLASCRPTPWSIAAGSYSPALVARFGERLPIYPVKGYSITAPIIDPERAPRHSLTDESRRIVCSRLGNVLRVAGTAELNGFDLSPNPARSASIVNWLEEHSARRWQISNEAQHWCGLRPATPSNVPLIGQDADRQSLSQYRPRHPGLDAGLRLGAGARRHHHRAQAGEPDFPFRT
jgi:D-amino-acid dehydrogenase